MNFFILNKLLKSRKKKFPLRKEKETKLSNNCAVNNI